MNNYQQVYDLIQTTLSRYALLRDSDLPKEELQKKLKEIEESHHRQYQAICEFSKTQKRGVR